VPLRIAPYAGLRKGSAFHWDFFVIGVLLFITGLLGLPPVDSGHFPCSEHTSLNLP
jgi:hypothetical protein